MVRAASVMSASSSPSASPSASGWPPASLGRDHVRQECAAMHDALLLARQGVDLLGREHGRRRTGRVVVRRGVTAGRFAGPPLPLRLTTLATRA